MVLSNRRRPDEHVHDTMVVETMTGQGKYHKSSLQEILSSFLVGMAKAVHRREQRAAAEGVVGWAGGKSK